MRDPWALLARLEANMRARAAARQERERHPELYVPKAERPACGARCRDGHPCRAPAVWDAKRGRLRNLRCRMHGGLSTGPRTAEGKARSIEGARKGAAARWYRWRDGRASTGG